MNDVLASFAPHPGAVALTRAGLLAIRDGQYRYSMVLLQRAVELDPALGEAWRWLGALHHGAHRAICLQWAQRTLPGATIPRLPTVQQPPEGAKVIAAPAPPRSMRRRTGRRVAVAVSAAALAALLAVGGFQAVYADRVFPGVQAFGHAVGGLSPAAVRAKLAPTLDQWAQQEVRLRGPNGGWLVRFGSLADFAPTTLAERAYGVGRQGDVLNRLSEQSGAVLHDTAIRGVPLNDDAVAKVLNDLVPLLARPAQNATIVRAADGTWSVQSETVGQELDRAAAEQMLREQWANLRWDGTATSIALDVPLRQVAPAISAAQLQPLLPTLQQQTAAPLTITAADKTWTLDRTQLLDLNTLPAAGALFGANRAAVQDVVNAIAAEYDQPAVPSRLERDGRYARSWSFGQQGRRVDAAQAVDAIAQWLQTGTADPLPLAVHTEDPPPGDLEALGIIGVVGEGHSQFNAYSSPNRDANVVSGGNEFDGLLVAPGELISFDDTVGEITADKGYQMGEMIAGGEVVPSYGGGICQVSTTMFRAAFWGGLDIEERHYHSWRLPWYETDAPPGMDATIALGGPDLKIRNTTDAYLLIDVITDVDAKTQQFILYGTPRNINVSLVGPTWAGGGIVIGRQIERDGQIVQEDSWTSYYSQ